MNNDQEQMVLFVKCDRYNGNSADDPKVNKLLREGWRLVNAWTPAMVGNAEPDTTCVVFVLLERDKRARQ